MLSCLCLPRLGAALSDHVTNPRTSENRRHHRPKCQRSARRWQNFRSSRRSWQRLEPIRPLRLLSLLSGSRTDLEGASIGFVRVRIIIVAELAAGRNLYTLVVGAAVPAVSRRPGASLANPNKAARRVTAVEFASDSDDA
jgi:hypothetical protein